MSAAQARMADALLRTVGGRTVQIRMPASAVAGDVNEELGRATPLFQDYPLAPAVFRRLRQRVANDGVQTEMLLSASAVNELAVTTGQDTNSQGSAETIFRDALGVMVDGRLYELLGVTAAEAFGDVYLWRLKLRGEVNAVV